jgi:hypothetical protein
LLAVIDPWPVAIDFEPIPTPSSEANTRKRYRKLRQPTSRFYPQAKDASIRSPSSRTIRAIRGSGRGPGQARRVRAKNELTKNLESTINGTVNGNLSILLLPLSALLLRGAAGGF